MYGHRIQVGGQLERAGGARYQHASHALVPLGGDRDIRFVLRSENVRLRDFEGQRVQVTGSLIEEGDPKLLDVFAVRPLFEASDGSLR